MRTLGALFAVVLSLQAHAGIVTTCYGHINYIGEKQSDIDELLVYKALEKMSPAAEVYTMSAPLEKGLRIFVKAERIEDETSTSTREFLSEILRGISKTDGPGLGNRRSVEVTGCSRVTLK